jgi:hypothetical protein
MAARGTSQILEEDRYLLGETQSCHGLGSKGTSSSHLSNWFLGTSFSGNEAKTLKLPAS